ncbi:deleted in malignant brain tumors 1 protein-like isoform X4 [Chanodichthys erythropterus]|uniref:deleted in malignant brain tumors 1 protein-like isoform X4 n=1 Tax=Chanodichthys erythropterus TaxID=933992 RepID=UPI00351ECB39
MEALNFFLCLLLTAYQANTVGSWTTGDWLYTSEVSSDSNSCRHNCGRSLGTCSCDDSCQDNRNCCYDYYSYCSETTTTTATTYWIDTTAPSCMWNCGYNFGSCSCTHDCQYYGNCCPDYDSYCSETTATTYWIDTTAPSCMYNCGYNFGSCSCTHDCQYYGNCCPDYDSYCSETTTTTATTYWIDTTAPSCMWNCGHNFGSCSCAYDCHNYINCCPDYDSYCSETTTTTTYWIDTTAPSCMWNCGYNFGSCSCTHDCQYYGNCCPDYDSYCFMTTTTTQETTATATQETTTEFIIADEGSCENNCGEFVSICGCDDRCQHFNDCCPDYDNYCLITTKWPTTTGFPSCMWNCGYDLGSCSCTHNCQYYGNCCPDYDSYCSETTTTTETTTTYWIDTTAPSCMWNCGHNFGSCSCAYDCHNYGNCCPDYDSYCSETTTTTATTYWIDTTAPSCMYNCGYNFGSCSCTHDCHNYGNCCPDYDSYCSETTTTATTYWIDTTAPSCIYNCGYNFSSCSCTHDCQYYGNCCPDFHWYCPSDTTWRDSTTESHPQCGGHLYGSGLFSSPNYPNYYHDNAYCVWYLSAQQGQRIFLSFVDVQLERCCNCDYISVYDGSSTGYPLLGKICFNDTTNQVLHSSSRYLTVVFRSDYSGVSHGFKALFTSSLTANEGHVNCSSDNMAIVIQQSYLNSLGYSGNDLYVDDHLCRPTITSSEVVFSFPLDTCGTAKEMMNGYVSYTNNVRASQSQSGEITRQSQFLLHVGCRMEPDSIVQIFYKAKEIMNANITGTGHFNASIAFYTSSSFYQQIYDSPYEVKLNQLLYVQVKLNRPDNSLDLFLDTCVASPNPNDFKDRSYDLLRNGCPRDNTYYSYTSGQHYYAQFSFRAFKFLRTHAYVYLQCKVIICPDNDYNSRCRQGCRYRRKRSLDSTYHTNTVTLGPIKLKGGRRAFRQREKIEAAE